MPEQQATPKRQAFQIKIDKAIAALSDLNPDHLDDFVDQLRAKKPRTAASLTDAFAQS